MTGRLCSDCGVSLGLAASHVHLCTACYRPERVYARLLVEAEPADGGCLLLLTGAATKGGYPIRVCAVGDGSKRGHTAARIAYTATYGDIPFGQTVHHKCGHPRCVTAAHLELATNRENIGEMHARKALEARIAHLERDLEALNGGAA